MKVHKRLLFVDTNIWLDFYRSKNEASIRLLKHLDTIRDSLIMTYQVETEFKKNRQEVILGSFQAMRMAEGNIPWPGFLTDAKSVKALKGDFKRANRRIDTLKARLIKTIENPTLNDPVYKVCQRCFHKSDSITLTREMAIRRQIRRRAFRRFLHGCPPRKAQDTSAGDAINWEWLIECASNCSSEIHIVSRDSDYGKEFDGRAYLNDHLLQEFKDRVSQKRKIVLHKSLSQALKLFEVSITEDEEKSELEIPLPSPPSVQELQLEQYIKSSDYWRQIRESLAKASSDLQKINNLQGG